MRMRRLNSARACWSSGVPLQGLSWGMMTHLEDICTMPQGSGVEQAERGSPSHMSPNDTANERESDADDLTVVDSPTSMY